MLQAALASVGRRRRPWPDSGKLLENAVKC